MRARWRRVVAGLGPLLPVVALAVSLCIEGAKRWR